MSNAETAAPSRRALRFGMFMGPFHATSLDPTYAINDALDFGRAAITAFVMLFLGLAFRKLAARGQLPWIRQ